MSDGQGLGREFANVDAAGEGCPAEATRNALVSRCETGAFIPDPCTQACACGGRKTPGLAVAGWRGGALCGGHIERTCEHGYGHAD